MPLINTPCWAYPMYQISQRKPPPPFPLCNCTLSLRHRFIPLQSVYLDIARFLISTLPDDALAVTDDEGNTPLHVACSVCASRLMCRGAALLKQFEVRAGPVMTRFFLESSPRRPPKNTLRTALCAGKAANR